MSQSSLGIQDVIEKDDQIDSRSTDSLESGTERRKEKLKQMIHVILGMGKESKHLDKICCIWKINKKTSAWRQLTTLFSIFLTVFMASIIGFLVFFVRFSPSYLGQSILQFVDNNVENNFQNSLLQYSNQIDSYFNSFNTWLITFSEILSNQANWSNSLFLNSTSPLLPKQQYFSAKESIPNNLLPFTTEYQKQKVVLSTFSYLAFKFEDFSSLTNEAKEALDQIDIISYFFKSFFFDPKISYIYSLFIYLQDTEIAGFFPARTLKYTNKYIPNIALTRPWYLNTIKSLKQSGNVANFVVTGPYHDLNTGLKMITYSYPILNQNNKTDLKGIISVDLIVNNFKSMYDGQEYTESDAKIALIDLETELIMNDCFKSKELINFYHSNITGFTQDDWKNILNTTLYKQKQVFILFDVNNTQYYFIRSFVQDNVFKKDKYMLLVFGIQQSFQEFRQGIQDKVESQLYNFGLILIITCIVIWGVSYFYIGGLSLFIVKPLSKLSQLAKGIYMKEQQERKNSTEDIKDRLAKIESNDIETKDLINAFINIIDQNSRIRKFPVSSLDSHHFKCSQSYPLNEYFGELVEIQQIIKQLPNHYNNLHSESSQLIETRIASPAEEQNSNNDSSSENDGQKENEKMNENNINSSRQNLLQNFDSKYNLIQKSSQKEQDENEIESDFNPIKKRIISLQKKNPDYCQEVITEFLPPIYSAI